MYGAANGLFARLRTSCAAEWKRYVEHPFVLGLADGTLPETAFRRYLVQDYLFLIHFSRAKALAVYKAESVAAMREAAAMLDLLLNTEMRLHVGYCAEWGITEAEIQQADEAEETMAYTRYVLERGLAGDILDLDVAMAPCALGYGEIATWINAHPARKRGGNRYESWIAMYEGAEYQTMCAEFGARLDNLSVLRGGEARFADLVKTFSQATRLEAAFWDMGLRGL